MGNHTATRSRGRSGGRASSTSPDPMAPITRRGGGVTVVYRNAQALAATRAMFGRALSPQALARVVGVYAPGAATTLTVRGTPTSKDNGLPFLLVDAEGPGFHTDHYLDRTSDGLLPGVHVYNQQRTYDRSVLGDQARALALRTQVRAARATGVTGIFAKAYTHHDGTTQEYLALPRMGYDAPRDRVEHENTPVHEGRATGWPARFARAQSLSDLLRLPGGAAWWEANGLNPDLRFNPAPGSANSRTLAAYLSQHGLPAL